MINEITIPITLNLMLHVRVHQGQELIEITAPVDHVLNIKTCTAPVVADRVDCFKCDVAGCGKVFENSRALKVHKTYHDPNKVTRWTKKRPALKVEKNFANGKTSADFGLEVGIVTCPNPDCYRRRTFVAKTGYMADGIEWCSKKCYLTTNSPDGKEE